MEKNAWPDDVTLSMYVVCTHETLVNLTLVHSKLFLLLY